jgi:NADH-quinone oxidoreductase subunit M
MSVPWLTLVIVIPAGAAMLLLLVPRSATRAVKGLTILACAAVAVIVAVLVANMPHTATAGATPPLTLFYTESRPWIPAIGASYSLGLDGLSAWMLALNAGVFLLGALAVSRARTERLRFYCAMLLLTETASAGVLLATDLLLFYLFWEGMLIPLYFLLSNYGGPKRGPATLKFIIYTVAGSLLMLASIIWLAINHASTDPNHALSFDLQALLTQPGPSQSALVIPGINVTTFTPQELVFIGFALAFAIKIPLVPFHTWLPDLYESAPTATLVFFAGIISKLGAFGFIRYALTLFAQPVSYFKWLLAAIAVLSIIYGALMALSERDIKRIVAYASISHLGFIALGIFSLNANGVNGAIIQIVNHGVIIAALFLVAGMIEQRTGTRDIREIGGMEMRAPWLYALFLVITLAGLGMPGMNSFVGEFTIMLGAFQLSWIFAVLAGVGVVLACWYMLRFHQGVMHGTVTPLTERVRDLRLGEGLLLAPLVAVMIFLGVYPRPLGAVASPSVSQYVGIVANPSAVTVAPP